MSQSTNFLNSLPQQLESGVMFNDEFDFFADQLDEMDLPQHVLDELQRPFDGKILSYLFLVHFILFLPLCQFKAIIFVFFFHYRFRDLYDQRASTEYEPDKQRHRAATMHKSRR